MDATCWIIDQGCLKEGGWPSQTWDTFPRKTSVNRNILNAQYEGLITLIAQHPDIDLKLVYSKVNGKKCLFTSDLLINPDGIIIDRGFCNEFAADRALRKIF